MTTGRPACLFHDAAEHGQAIVTGQQQVQQDYIGFLVLQFGQTTRAIGRAVHAVSRTLEQAGQHAPECWLHRQ